MGDAFVLWWEATLPAGRLGDTRIMNVGEACWRGAVEACAKQVELAGCMCVASWIAAHMNEPDVHEDSCPQALAAALREELA